MVKKSVCHVGKNVWCATRFRAPGNSFNGGRLQCENIEVYGVRMLDNAQRYKLIPEEIFSKQNCTANNGGLAKTLFYDIACQTRSSAAIASVDVSNYYNWIAHTMASLIFQSFGLESTAVSAMLETI
jgi:hypothetical protein